jgi:hypothetical protein
LHFIALSLSRNEIAPRIRIQSKQKAGERLARELGLYREKTRATCCEHFVERVQASRAKPAAIAEP